MEFSGRSGKGREADYMDFHVKYPPDPYGFSVRTERFWKRIEIRYVPDDYSGPLIESMGRSEDGLLAFAALADLAGERNGKIELSVSGSPADPASLTVSETSWTGFSLKLTVYADDDTNLADTSSSAGFLKDWIVLFTQMVITLLPVEEIRDDPEASGCQEGRSHRAMVKRYERSRLNRSACIAIHGATCRICGCDFSERYGPIGEGFIHVHHLIPVSALGEGYRVNPRTDLIPVCPNCHVMLHMTDPPMSVDALRSMIRRNT